MLQCTTAPADRLNAQIPIAAISYSELTGPSINGSPQTDIKKNLLMQQAGGKTVCQDTNHFHMNFYNRTTAGVEFNDRIGSATTIVSVGEPENIATVFLVTISSAAR